MKTQITTLLVALLVTGLVACAGQADPTGSRRSNLVSPEETAYLASLTDREKSGILHLVNDGRTTQEVLDVDCGLHSDAAKHIIKYKLRYGWFRTIEDLADVNEVGLWNLQQLHGCAVERGWILTERTELIEDYAALSPELQARVDELILWRDRETACYAGEYYEPGCSWPHVFGSVEITYLGDTPIEYQVTLYEPYDPEFWAIVEITLDADLEVIDLLTYG